MNLLLLSPNAEERPLVIPPGHPLHPAITRLTRGNERCPLRAGVPGGARFLVVAEKTGDSFRLERDGPLHPSAPLWPLRVLVGAPRPATFQRILRSLVELGVGHIGFYRGEKTPASYLEASCWQPDHLQPLLAEAVTQSFQTIFPVVEKFPSLAAALAANPVEGLAYLDPYADQPVNAIPASSGDFTLLFGCDGGFSPEERRLLAAQNASGFHLGPRILKTDTAVVAAVAYWGARSGQWAHAREASFPGDRERNRPEDYSDRAAAGPA